VSVHPPARMVAPPATTRLEGTVMVTGRPGGAYMPSGCQYVSFVLPLICKQAGRQQHGQAAAEHMAMGQLTYGAQQAE